METEADAVLRLVGGKSSVRLIPGSYRGLDSTFRAIVDFDGGRVPAYLLGARPEVNDAVWVMVVDGVAYVVGSSVPKPSEGVVESFTTDPYTAVVSSDVGEFTVLYPPSLLLDVGDKVRLLWHGGGWVLDISEPATQGAPPPGPGGGGRSTVEFTAIDSGSYQAGFGWRTNEVWSSASNKGAWFYGSSIRDTIPDSASIVSAEIFLPSPSNQIGARPFGRHTYDAKPGGAPTITDTSTLPGVSGWVPIPTTHIDYLKVNPGGLGFDLGGWWIWAGTQGNGSSGRLRVTYDI